MQSLFLVCDSSDPVNSIRPCISCSTRPFYFCYLKTVLHSQSCHVRAGDNQDLKVPWATWLAFLTYGFHSVCFFHSEKKNKKKNELTFLNLYHHFVTDLLCVCYWKQKTYVLLENEVKRFERVLKIACEFFPQLQGSIYKRPISCTDKL